MISVPNITKIFHNKTVLNQINFELVYRNIVDLMGSNGVRPPPLRNNGIAESRRWTCRNGQYFF